MTKAAVTTIRTKGEKTKEIILNAAVDLFAEGNYDSISMRDVAQKANVLLGLVTYHFKSKEALFEAVASRYAGEATRICLDELRRHKTPSLEQIIDAFIRPMLMRSQQPGWRKYMRVVVQVNQQERWADLNASLFGAMAEEFFGALQRAMPGTSKELLTRGYIYMVSVFLSIIQENSKLARFSKGVYSADDISKVYRSALPFLAGGFRALAIAESAGTPVDLSQPEDLPTS